MEYEEPKFFHVMQYAGAADGDVIDMVSGNPDWEPPATLREALREYADLPSAEFQYPPSEGLLELREAIAERRNVDADRVVVTNGTGEANYLAIARAFERDAGDEALLMDPVYPYYPGKTDMLGGESTLVPTERDGGLDVDAIREAASEDTALIVLNTPNNPTGAVYDLDAVREVVAVADAVDALVMVDEVYDHFDLTGEFESALMLDSDRVIVTSGFSKSMAITGFRVGYGIFPEAHVGDAKTRHMLVNVAGARPPSTRSTTRSRRRRRATTRKPANCSLTAWTRSPTRSTRRARSTPARRGRSTCSRASRGSPNDGERQAPDRRGRRRRDAGATRSAPPAASGSGSPW